MVDDAATAETPTTQHQHQQQQDQQLTSTSVRRRKWQRGRGASANNAVVPAAKSNTQNTNTNTTTHTHTHSSYSFWFSMLNPRSKQWQAIAYQRFATTVIALDVILWIASTDPRIQSQSPQSQQQQQYSYHRVGLAWAHASVHVLFLLEYMVRFVTSMEQRPSLGRSGPIRGRLALAVGTFASCLELGLATAPVAAACLAAAAAATAAGQPQQPQPQWTWTTAVLGTVRLARILKIPAYVRAMDAAYRVMYYNAEILTVAVLVCLFLTLATAVLLYVLRPPDRVSLSSSSSSLSSSPLNSGVDDFSSMGATLYLAIAMLTGQGGPQQSSSEHPLPWYTKAVVVLTSLVSVAFFAIPASMVTWGWEAEAARMAKRARKRAVQKTRTTTQQSQQRHAMRGGKSMVVIRSTTRGSSSEEDSDSTDEEYFRLIAGEQEDDPDAEESSRMQKLREAFTNLDHNADGTLSLSEATNLLAFMQQEQHSSDECNTNVRNRLAVLENEHAKIHKKLDQILHLLQKQSKLKI